MGRKNRIKNSITKKPYVYSLPLIFLGYLLINVWINKWHITLPGIFKTNLWITGPYFVFSLIIAFLVALALNLAHLRIVELQHVSKASSITFFGAFFGVLTGSCPGCLVGIFPAVIGIFGGTFSQADLPLYGIEIQLITILLMIFAIRTLSKDHTCKIKSK